MNRRFTAVTCEQLPEGFGPTAGGLGTVGKQSSPLISAQISQPESLAAPMVVSPITAERPEPQHPTFLPGYRDCGIRTGTGALAGCVIGNLPFRIVSLSTTRNAERSAGQPASLVQFSSAAAATCRRQPFLPLNGLGDCEGRRARGHTGPHETTRDRHDPHEPHEAPPGPLDRLLFWSCEHLSSPGTPTELEALGVMPQRAWIEIAPHFAIGHRYGRYVWRLPRAAREPRQ